MRIRRIHVLLAALGVVACLIPSQAPLRSALGSTLQAAGYRSTVSDRVAEFGNAVRERLQPAFAEIGVSYPPRRIILVGLKQERLLEVWVASDNGPFRFLKSYPILAASGTLGPKLKEGDGQVPEGLYRIESLNPNSRFHLSLRLDYPNEFDKAMGAREGRDRLGSDIMIHGNFVSIGCLAMGDQAAEDLFVLAAETGTERIRVILSPLDFRKRDLPQNLPSQRSWTTELYSDIRRELLKLPSAAIPAGGTARGAIRDP